MSIFYLAIDISKEGGRHIMGRQEEGKLKLEETYSFYTGYTESEGKSLWDLQYIFEQIKVGISGCLENGRLPVLVGVTACDGHFVLLDQADRVIDDMVFSLDSIGTEEKDNNLSAFSDKAACFLMLSDYFNFLLTGKKQCEYTNLLPGKLISWDKRDWDQEYIIALGLNPVIFPPVAQPGSVIGNLTLEVTEELGYDFIVIQPASRKASTAIAKLPEFNSCNNSGGDMADKLKAEDYDKEEERQQTKNIIPDELKPAIGAICIMMISSHELKDLEAARELIANSFTISEDEVNQ